MDLGTLMIYHTGEKTMNREQIEEQRESIKKAELVVESLDVIINSLTNAFSEFYVNHTDLNNKVALAYAINNKVGEILCDIDK